MAKTKIPGEYLKDSVVRFTAKAGENITKGQAVYISGVSGEKPVVSLADADDTNKMPAFGLAESTVLTNASVEITSSGTIAGIDTSSYALGDILYISTTAGSLTNDPSGLEASKVQNIGMVQRVHASNGSIKVGGAGRTNATPNLNDGNIFVGNSSNKSVADSFTDVLNDQAGINSSANATAITIDSSENVGIGTDNPSAKLTVAGGSDMGIRIISDADGYASLQFGDVDDSVRGGITYNSADDSLQLRGYNNTTRATIDASGNLLVGTTSTATNDVGFKVFQSTGQTVTTSSGTNPVLFNRKTSDGDIAVFRKDDTTAGSIGSEGGDSLYVQGGTTSGSGLLYHGTGGKVLPARNSTSVDATIDLGQDSRRFKDLYLSGSVSSASNTDTQSVFGRTAIGFVSGLSDFAFVGHVDAATSSNYGFVQSSSGATYLNGASGQSVNLQIGGSRKVVLDASGNVGIGTTSVTNNTNRTTLGLQGAWGGQLDIMVGSTVHAQFGTDNFSSGQSCRIQSQDGIVFKSGGSSERWRLNSSGHLTPAQQHTYDIGGVNAEARNIYAQGLYVGGSAAANKLDDYEEGTWTPVLGPGSGQSYGNRSGHYTKVGRMVTAYFGCRLTAGSFTGGEATISGLPFAVHATGSYQEPQFVIYTLGGAPTGQTNGLNNGAYLPGQVSFYLGGGETFGRGRKYSNNADAVLDANEVFDSNSFIKGIVTYYTA